MTGFTTGLWREIAPVYQAILDHPFNLELAKGSLSRERFSFYLGQDRLYLADFGRALALLAGRLRDPGRTLSLLRFSERAVEVERGLHEQYFRLFGIRQPPAEKSPACFAYTNFLLSTVALATCEEGMAALLPCFWIYREVGRFIHGRATADNPYGQWIATYAGEDFSSSVDSALDLTEALAAEATDKTRGLMTQAFATASRLEWMFWDSAYALEAWRPGPAEPPRQGRDR